MSRVTTSASVGTAGIDTSLPDIVRPGASVEITVEVTGGIGDHVLDHFDLFVWARNGAGRMTRDEPESNQRGRRIVQQHTIARDVRIHAAERRTVARSVELSPDLPLSLGDTCVEVTTTVPHRAELVSAPRPIDVRPTARMAQFFEAVSDLGFSLYGTNLGGNPDSREEISGPRQPVQTIVFEAQSGRFAESGQKLVASFEPADSRLHVPIRVIQADDWDSAVDIDRSGVDRLTIRDTDPQAVRNDLLHYLENGNGNPENGIG